MRERLLIFTQLSPLKSRERRRKARGDYYKPYIDVDDIDLALDEETYRRFEDLPPDHPDFQAGPDRRDDAQFLHRSRELRFIHDRPHIEKYVEELEAARARMRMRDPACVSAGVCVCVQVRAGVCVRVRRRVQCA